MTASPLLEVRNLGVTFPTPKGLFHAVRDVSWSVSASETLAILGESGSGKSVSAATVMNLIDTRRRSSPRGRSCSMAATC